MDAADAWRRSARAAPPICIRQELSAAVQTSAPVSITARTLSAAIAVETSAFLTANVPPKPQHSSLCGRSASCEPAHGPQQPRRAITETQRAKRMTGRVERHVVRVEGADVGDTELVDEQLGELEDRGRSDATASISAASPVSAAIFG